MYNHNIPKIEETKSYKINITELKQMSDDELIDVIGNMPAKEFIRQRKAMSKEESDELDYFLDNVMSDHVFNEIIRIREKRTKETENRIKEIEEHIRIQEEQNEKSLNALEKMCDSLLDDCRQAINDIHSITNSIDTVIGNDK